MCLTRPTCLDLDPPCTIAEPAQGWCPEDSEVTGLQRAKEVLVGFEARIAKLQQFWMDMSTQAQSITDVSRQTQLLTVIQRHLDKLTQILAHLREVKNVILDRIQAKLVASGMAGLGLFGRIGQIPDTSVFNDPLRQEEAQALAFQNQTQMTSSVVITATADDGGMGLVMLVALGLFAAFAMKGRY